jgi:hypothetical protein
MYRSPFYLLNNIKFKYSPMRLLRLSVVNFTLHSGTEKSFNELWTSYEIDFVKEDLFDIEVLLLCRVKEALGVRAEYSLPEAGFGDDLV